MCLRGCTTRRSGLEVKAALVGVFDLCPLRFYAFFEGDDVVVGAYAFPHDDYEDDGNDDKGFFHVGSNMLTV